MHRWFDGICEVGVVGEYQAKIDEGEPAVPPSSKPWMDISGHSDKSWASYRTVMPVREARMLAVPRPLPTWLRKIVLSMGLSRGAWNRLRDVRDSFRELRTYVLKQGFQSRALANFCRGKSALLLNIGCGPLTKTGWINIDFQPRDANTFYFDVRNGLPLPDGSVKHIHSEHFLGYLDYDEALQFLRDCRRMLENGGTMRIIVPDFEKYIRSYAAGDTAFFNALRHLGGAVKPLTTKAMVCNQTCRLGGAYKFSWDFETLEQAALSCGFSQVVRSKINESPPKLAIDGQDWWRPFESLYANLLK